MTLETYCIKSETPSKMAEVTIYEDRSVMLTIVGHDGRSVPIAFNEQDRIALIQALLGKEN